MINKVVLIVLLWLATAIARATIPITLQLVSVEDKPLVTAQPVIPPLPAPQGLCPYCAFGYDLYVQVLHTLVSLYGLDNVVTIDSIGRHRYNDSLLLGLVNLTGIGHRNNGIVYTACGDFINTACARDTVDMTTRLFSHLLPRFGQSLALRLDDELARRHVVSNVFAPPTKPINRYALAAWAAARLAFQLVAWHKAAQWCGSESVPGSSEEVLAFSPEDLYSNLLGTGIAVSLILNEQLVTAEMYGTAMNNVLRQALMQPRAKPEKITRFQFDMLDGKRWNNRRRVPEKYLALHGNHGVSDPRLLTPVPGKQASPLRLMSPYHWREYSLDALAQLEL